MQILIAVPRGGATDGSLETSLREMEQSLVGVLRQHLDVIERAPLGSPLRELLERQATELRTLVHCHDVQRWRAVLAAHRRTT